MWCTQCTISSLRITRRRVGMPSKPGAFRAFSARRARSASEREIVKDASSWLSSVIGAASIGGGSPSIVDWEACLTKTALRISALSMSFSTRLPESSSKGGVNDGLLLVKTVRNINWYRSGKLCGCGILLVVAATGSPSRAEWLQLVLLFWCSPGASVKIKSDLAVRSIDVTLLHCRSCLNMFHPCSVGFCL